MGIGAAIGGVVGGIGSLVGGSKQASAATSAADTQAQAAQQSIAATQKEQAQIRSDLMPFTQGAQTSGDLSAYNNFEAGAVPILNSFNSAAAMMQPGSMTEADLVKTPGYQFDLDQGLKSIQSSNAAKGLGVSGAALKGATTYATGLADNTYQNQFGIKQQQFNDALSTSNLIRNQLNDEFGYLSAPVQTSQNSAAMTANTGMQSTANANNALMAGANATAAGAVGSANAMTSGFNGAANAATNGMQNYMLAQALQNNGGGSNSNNSNNSNNGGYSAGFSV